MKKYYGCRFLGGNRTCTMGEPHPRTGRVSTACEIMVFDKKELLESWLAKEKLTAPIGYGGGERIRIMAKDVRYHLRGMTVKEREDYFLSIGVQQGMFHPERKIL